MKVTIFSYIQATKRSTLHAVYEYMQSVHGLQFSELSLIRSFECSTEYIVFWGTRWCSWLRHRATSRKVAGSILDVVT